MEKPAVAQIVEMGLLSSGRPCTVAKLRALFEDREKVTKGDISEALDEISERWRGRAIELRQTAGGWQLASAPEHGERLRKFLEATPPRLSRAMYEVLTIVAYPQPVTRGDIEKIRGVSTSANQLAYLEEIGWVEATGKRDTPGRPIEYGTTARFLDDLGLRKVEELPDLEEFDKESVGVADAGKAAADGGDDG